MLFKDVMEKTGIEYSGFDHPVDEYGYWNINISFIDSDGTVDVTQFDVNPNIEGDKCWLELESLWKDFCKEFGFSEDSITDIYFPYG